MKKRFRAVIVDDERLARNDLKSILTEHDNVEILGEAEDVESAIEVIGRLQPDVIFLDIQMPGASGFDLMDRIDVNARIIFITAFDEYAIRAFEVNALDYLLKPINPERLAKAIERLETDDAIEQRDGKELDYEDRLFFTLGTQLRFLEVKRIVAISSAGDYSDVLTCDGQKSLALKSMKEWERRLPEKYFIRIHRSTIINMAYIDRLEEWFNYSYRVYMKGVEAPFIMSRRYAAKLKARMG